MRGIHRGQKAKWSSLKRIGLCFLCFTHSCLHERRVFKILINSNPSLKWPTGMKIFNRDSHWMVSQYFRDPRETSCDSVEPRNATSVSKDMSSLVGWLTTTRRYHKGTLFSLSAFLNLSFTSPRYNLKVSSNASPLLLDYYFILTICPFMPCTRCVGKSIPSVLQVIDVLENGTKRKYVFYYVLRH